jgi:hypothetical protein
VNTCVPCVAGMMVLQAHHQPHIQQSLSALNSQASLCELIGLDAQTIGQMIGASEIKEQLLSLVSMTKATMATGEVTQEVAHQTTVKHAISLVSKFSTGDSKASVGRLWLLEALESRQALSAGALRIHSLLYSARSTIKLDLIMALAKLACVVTPTVEYYNWLCLNISDVPSPRSSGADSLQWLGEYVADGGGMAKCEVQVMEMLGQVDLLSTRSTTNLLDGAVVPKYKGQGLILGRMWCAKLRALHDEFMADIATAVDRAMHISESHLEAAFQLLEQVVEEEGDTLVTTPSLDSGSLNSEDDIFELLLTSAG